MENNGRIDEFLCNYISKRNNEELNIFKIITENLPEYCCIPEELGIAEDYEFVGDWYVYFSSYRYENGCRWRVPVHAFIIDKKLEGKDINELLKQLDNLRVIRVA